MVTVHVLLILGLFLHTCVVVECEDDYTYNHIVYLGENQTNPCIHVNLMLSAVIHYVTEDGSVSTLRIAGSNFTTATYTCNFNSNTATASVNITWPSEEPYYSLKIMFSADFEEGWEVRRMELHINTVNNPDFNETSSEDYIMLHNDKDLTVDNITLYKSYKCDASVTHSFSSSDYNSTAVLTTTSFQLQAFQFSDNSGNFGSADMQCVEDVDDSKVIPIIVGTIITTVILAALILYIIARVVKHRKDSKQSILT